MSEWKDQKLDIFLLFVFCLIVLIVVLKLGVHIEESPKREAEEASVTMIATATPTITMRPTATALPTATCTPTPAPTATSTPTIAPTATCTPTPTITVAPTCTEKPVERISTPKPTNTSTPTKKAEKPRSEAYPTGCPGTKSVESGHDFKPYARYQAITNKASVQYKLVQREKTATNGLRYVVDSNDVKRYCIALAPQWAGGTGKDIGRCIDIKMKNGATLHCVLADVKKPEHTQKKEGYYGDGHGELIEFIVDQSKLPEKARLCGDISYVSSEFAGDAVSVIVLDQFISGFGE